MLCESPDSMKRYWIFLDLVGQHKTSRSANIKDQASKKIAQLKKSLRSTDPKVRATQGSSSIAKCLLRLCEHFAFLGICAWRADKSLGADPPLSSSNASHARGQRSMSGQWCRQRGSQIWQRMASYPIVFSNALSSPIGIDSKFYTKGQCLS